MKRKTEQPEDYVNRVVQAIIEGKETLKDFEYTILFHRNSNRILSQVKQKLHEAQFKVV